MHCFLSAGKLRDVYLFADRPEPQHFDVLRRERSHEREGFAKRDLIRRLAGLDFVQHLVALGHAA